MGNPQAAKQISTSKGERNTSKYATYHKIKKTILLLILIVVQFRQNYHSSSN